MDYENIIAGLTPGGSNKVYEARILICFLLNYLKKPLSRTDINNILQCQSLINYFTFSQAFNDLIKDGQLIVYGEEEIDEKRYVLTPKGNQTSKVFKDTIALTIREKISLAADHYLKDKKLLKDNVVNIEKVDDGYIVSFRIKDIGSDLMTMSIFSPDEGTAQVMKKNFINRSLEIYRQVFDFLVTDKKERFGKDREN